MNRHRRSRRCTCRGRGWGYRGEHRVGRGAWTVDDVRKSLRPKEGEPVLLQTLVWNAVVYGVVPDHNEPQMVTVTLETAEPAVLSLAALAPALEAP